MVGEIQIFMIVLGVVLIFSLNCIFRCIHFASDNLMPRSVLLTLVFFFFFLLILAKGNQDPKRVGQRNGLMNRQALS